MPKVKIENGARKAKKNTWIPVNDGEKIPLLGREDYITKVLNNVKTEEDLDNLLTLQELTEIEDVYQYLIKNSDVKAIEIANHLGIPRELVNHVLYKKTDYGLRGFVQKNKYNEWSIKYE